MSDADKQAVFNLKLLEKLSANDLVETWLAEEEKTGLKYCLKMTDSENADRVDDRLAYLEKSYSLQSSIRDRRFVTALHRRRHKGRPVFIYPYRDPRFWKRLTDEIFWRYYPQSLIRICSILDLLHAKNLVHGDVKFENFLCLEDTGEVTLVLTDFDFLCQDGDKPRAKIFGTPEFIAPEIMANHEVVIQSDNYSLGQALRRALEQRENPGLSQAGETGSGAIGGIIDSLLTPDTFNRPSFLGRSLLEAGILTAEAFNAYLRVLIERQLKAGFREHKDNFRKGEIDIHTLLRHRNQICGVPGELFRDLSGLRPLQLYHAVFALLREASVDRIGEFWHLSPGVDYLNYIYGKFDLLADYELPEFKASDDEEYTQYLDNIARKAVLSGEALKAFVRLYDDYSSFKDQPESFDADRVGRILLFAALSEKVGYPSYAFEIYDRLSNMDMPLNLKRQIKYKYVFRCIHRNDNERAEKLIAEELDRGITDDIGREYLRLQAWLYRARGEFGKSQEILEGLLAFFAAAKKALKMVRISHDLAMIHKGRGEMKSAVTLLRRGMKIMAATGEYEGFINLSASLCSTYTDISEYNKCLKNVIRTLERARSGGPAVNLPVICLFGTLALTRMGAHDKAATHFQKYIELAQGNKAYYHNYYLYRGYMLLWRGNLREAEKNLRLSETILGRNDYSRESAKLHHILTLLYYFTGNKEKFDNSFARAIACYTRQKDEQCLIELELLRHIQCPRGERFGKEFWNYLARAIEVRGIDISVMVLLMALLNGENRNFRFPSQVQWLLNRISRQPNIPLFATVSCLVQKEKGHFVPRPLDVNVLKKAFQTLESAGLRYFAAEVCARIGEIYEKSGSDKLASRYYRYAQDMNAAIGNEIKNNALTERISRLSSPSRDEGGLAETFLRISEIISNIDEYEDAVRYLVKFAVDETGAERGVLLLRKRDNPGEFITEAAYNCDNESLEDIVQISHNVPRQAVDEGVPYIIDDAINDKQTSEYKSIIKHNIRSVICIPIKINTFLDAVLYLDHHTIPALFDQTDITLSKSLANFISAVMRTMKKYRAMQIYQEQVRSANLLYGGFLTRDVKAMEMLSPIPQIARSDTDVLILGESGTGKELIAAMIHDLSSRNKAPFVRINCAAIASSLLESELFGIDKHTASGVEEKQGRFAAADGGTLFIDEVGDMPLEMQAKILRVIEYQEYQKVGSSKTSYVDVRYVYATNRDLQALVKTGRFREDLYYRMDKITLNIPPLRERPDDVEMLIEHFIHHFQPNEMERPIFNKPILSLLKDYEWRGNVRQLKNLVERLCLLFPGKVITKGNLPQEIVEFTGPGFRKANIDRDLKSMIDRCLKKHGGNQSSAARELKIPLSTLRRRIKEFNL